MLLQTTAAAGQKSVPQPFSAGVVMNALFEIDLSGGYTSATDKIELGVLMAYATLVRAQVIGDGVGAVNVDVGLMDGEVSDPDDSRTVGNEIFDGVSVNDATEDADRLDLMAIESVDYHRSIGAVLSGDVAAGAGKRLILSIDYVM